MNAFDADTPYDLVIAGTGFASSFFLHAFLEKAGPRARVLVLERFPLRTHRWQLENRETFDDSSKPLWVNATPPKTWIFSPSFGGGSNCWWGCTPRFLPADFALHSTYGVGRDWPIGYADLEEYYCQAEALIAVAGPENPLYLRSRPLPQPPHRLNKAEQMLKAGFPGRFLEMAVARPTRPTARRPACCGSGVCRHCPVDAKFTVLNEMHHLYEDPRVTLLLEAEVTRLDTEAGRVRGVAFRQGGQELLARGDLVALGANALFNPFILLRSGDRHDLLGRRLHEQLGVAVIVDLDGVDNYGGSTSLSGHGYMFYDGPHRKDRGAVLIETSNVPEDLRFEPGKWRRRMLLKFVIEDLPSEENLVAVDPANPGKPLVSHHSYSEYARRGVAAIPEQVNEIAKVLPIERIVSLSEAPTQNHIQGTTIMGADPQTSVVDRHLVHHRFRNLVVLGSSVFPSCTAANPSLTISALSLWAAQHQFS